VVDIAAPGAYILIEVDCSMLPTLKTLINYVNIMCNVYDYLIKVQH
jgi:hypothetical protein